MQTRCITTTKRTEKKTKKTTSKRKQTELDVVVLCARPGYRLKGFGAVPLIKLNNNTIFDIMSHEIHLAFPDANIILVTGFDGKRVASKISNVQLIENQLYEDTNTAEDLRLALNCSNSDKVLVVGSSYILGSSVLKRLDTDQSTVLISKENHINKLSIGVCASDEKVTNFSYGLPDKWLEAFCLQKSDLDKTKKLLNNYPKEKMLIFEILNNLINKNCSFSPVYFSDPNLIIIDHNNKDIHK